MSCRKWAVVFLVTKHSLVRLFTRLLSDFLVYDQILSQCQTTTLPQVLLLIGATARARALLHKAEMASHRAATPLSNSRTINSRVTAVTSNRVISRDTNRVPHSRAATTSRVLHKVVTTSSSSLSSNTMFSSRNRAVEARAA